VAERIDEHGKAGAPEHVGRLGDALRASVDGAFERGVDVGRSRVAERDRDRREFVLGRRFDRAVAAVSGK